MSLSVGLLVAAAIAVAAATSGGLVLHRLGRPMPVSGRRARRIMSVGGFIPVAWIAVVGVLAARSGASEIHVHTWAVIGSIGVTASALLLLAGIERLPGVVDSVQTRLRRRLDMLMMASSLFMSGWILIVVFANDGRPIHLHPSWSYLTGGPPVVAATLAVAFATTMIARAGRGRGAVALLMTGVVGIAVGGMVIVVGLLANSVPSVVAGGATSGAGLLVLAGCGLLGNQLLELPPDSAPTRWWLSAVTISLALLTIVLEVQKTGSLDAVAAAAGVTTGFALVSRQGLALVDANRLSARLQDDEVHLREMAFTDALTGIANRRELLRVLDDEAVGGPPCVLLSIDLDGFKSVNDLRGHDVGDGVLAEVAARLRANLRPGDLAARMGGDEFAVLMWAAEEPAIAAANRLLIRLGLPYETAGGSVFVSASIGLAGCASATSTAELLRNADLALRFAKIRGKARCEPYDKKYEEWLRRRTDVEHELHGAVQRAELSLVFQPVFSLPGVVPVGVEALVRWNHPRLGTIAPDEFIPIAEESGLISKVDTWVLNEACRQLGRWLETGHELWLAVNISARELHLVDYVTQVLDTLRTHHLPPERLVLEITERTVAQDIDELVGQLADLRSHGVRIALDDFGAGYSSLGQLRTLPVDILKIDRSLVGEPERPDTSREAATLVDVVVRLGRRLGLDVIAEGVAEEPERTIVEGAGCKLVQGDLFARAMLAEHIEALLSTAPVRIPRSRRAAPSTRRVR